MSGLYTRAYSIAGRVFSYKTDSRPILNLLGAYESDKTPDFSLSVNECDIEKEKSKLSPELLCDAKDIPLSQIEFSALCRKLSERLILDNILLFHGSAIAYNGGAYIFTAPSGTGKSTHTRLWREMLGNKVTMINDDKPFLRFGEKIYVCGSPWNGKHRLGENISAPLRGIAILSRSSDNIITRLQGKELEKAFFTLVSQTYRPPSSEALSIVLRLISDMARRVPIYRLECNMSPNAALCSFGEMTKQ